ncbi:Reticuline oxidase-like protein [Planoprotostelium fungivorum]|uniref:Reticuline oxidase-like protein n=1 Tax=Planoprotostelium fungivorum TaxID=1890364 RepID=A0A2P6N192_9EUKA|nr:Reticuline oxidase-like protein [Planoprotostelium fungivorum]
MHRSEKPHQTALTTALHSVEAVVQELMPHKPVFLLDEEDKKAVEFADLLSKDAQFKGRIVTRARGEHHSVHAELPRCDYELARRLPAKRLDRKPLLVAFCSSSSDVSLSVKAIRAVWPKDTPKVNIRSGDTYRSSPTLTRSSGGHSYEGISCEDDAIVIDVCPLNQVTIDSGKEGLWAGAGCKMGKLYYAIAHDAGHEYELPAGTGTSVGAGGVMTGGGYGMLARKIGLSSDLIIGMEMVDANGDLIMVDEKSHPDLFWALRGAGGGSYGVVTKFHLKTVKNPKKVTLVNIEWNFRYIKEVIAAYEEWQPYATDNLTTQLNCRPTHVHLEGKFIGNPAECAKLFYESPLMDLERCPARSFHTMYLSPSKVNLKVSCGIETEDFEEFIMDSPPYCGAWQEEMKSKKKSDFVYKHGKKFGMEGAAVVEAKLKEEKGKLANCQFEGYGGFFSTVKEGDTPYPHREDATISLQYWTHWNDEGLKNEEEKRKRNAEYEEWMREWERQLAPHVSGKKYRNYEDLDVLSHNWGEVYYGENFDRLKEIKSKYDPTNVFRCSFSIPLK